MATLLPLQAAIAALFAALAIWVLVAQPRQRGNQVFAVLLLLLAGSTVAYQLMRDATTPEGFATARRSADLYEVLTPFLTLYLVDELFLPKPRTGARKAALAGLAVLNLALAAALIVTAPSDTFTKSPTSSGFNPGPQSVFHVADATVVFAIGAVAVAVAAWSAGRGESMLRRRQAGLVAISFGFLIAHTVGQSLGAAVFGVTPASIGWGIPQAATSLAGLAALGFALWRVPPAFDRPARTAAVFAFVLPLVLGMVDSSAFTREGAYVGSRAIWVTGSAVALALAILRYDLTGSATPERSRRSRMTAGLLMLGLAGIVAGYAVSFLGATAVGLGVGLVVLATPVAFAAAPLRSVSRLSARLLLDARDPAVVRERVRVYTDALRASLARGGTPLDGDAALRDLRAQLGLSDRDHALLLSSLDTSHETLAPGSLLLGRYRIARELGRGGFGEAFLARDEREGRDVVLKRLVGEQRREAAAMRRFQREARLAAALQHPHIVAVLGVERAGPDAYLVMEYVPGGTLAERLAGGALPELDAMRIGLDVLDALAALHVQGIVHRDVKPSNILLTAEGRAKLGDFTIAQDLVSGETVGATGPVGTFAYMAPEQARSLPATPRTDLYALGATLYEAVSGTQPIPVDGLGSFEACSRIVRDEPGWPTRGASPALDRALRRALAKDPDARFASADEMARALRAAATLPSRAGTRAGSARPRPRRPT